MKIFDVFSVKHSKPYLKEHNSRTKPYLKEHNKKRDLFSSLFRSSSSLYVSVILAVSYLFTRLAGYLESSEISCDTHKLSRHPCYKKKIIRSLPNYMIVFLDIFMKQ